MRPWMNVVLLIGGLLVFLYLMSLVGNRIPT